MNIAVSRQEQIDAEAAGWMVAIECGSADREAFERWRADDPAHALAFLRAAEVSHGLNALRDSGLGSEAPAVREDEEQAVAGRRRLLKFGVAGILAAGVAGVAGLSWSLSAAAHEVETAVGERRRVVIAQGIALELNTDSQVKWRRHDDAYDIELVRGEMMLERQPGSPPCHLDCGQSEIEVAGGGKVVARARPRGVDVSVLRGEALLELPAAAPLRLATLNKVRVIGETPSVSRLTPLEAGAVSAWQQGQLQFNGERLEDAVSEYNRYLPRPIEIADPSIRNLRLGGRFSATDPTDFCRALKQIYGVSSRVEPDRIRLARS